MDPSGTGWNHAVGDDFPRDITILRTKTWLSYENGSIADIKTGIYEHHVAYPDLSQSTPAVFSCKNGWGFGGVKVPVAIFMGGSVDGGSGLLTSPDGTF